VIKIAIVDRNDGDILRGSDWQSVIDTVEDTSTGHDHDGSDSKSLDWDDCWSDAVHTHTSDAEGGKHTKSINVIDIYSELTDPGFIVGHSSDTASYSSMNSGVKQTTDYTSGNITWTSRNTNMINTTTLIGVNCKADRTYACCLEHTGDGAYTTDSGANWSDSTANPADVTAIFDLSFPTTTLAVAFGQNSAAGENIWRSTDGGNNWSNATDDGAGAAIGCGDMFDGSDGFAVVKDGVDIYSTSDGGDNWSDTTRNAPATVDTNSSMLALSSTEYIIAQASQGIYKGTTSADPTMKSFVSSGYYPSKIVKTTNGDVYVAWMYIGVDTTVLKPITLSRSTDSGDTWTQTMLYPGYGDNTNTNNFKFCLSEAANNVLILVVNMGFGAPGSAIIELSVA